MYSLSVCSDATTSAACASVVPSEQTSSSHIILYRSRLWQEKDDRRWVTWLRVTGGAEKKISLGSETLTNSEMCTGEIRRYTHWFVAWVKWWIKNSKVWHGATFVIRLVTVLPMPSVVFCQRSCTFHLSVCSCLFLFWCFEEDQGRSLEKSPNR